MDKVTLMIRLLCVVLIMAIGIAWLAGFITHYKGVKTEQESRWGTQNYTFGDYVFGDTHHGNRGLGFFASVLLIVVGIYMLTSMFLPIKVMNHDQRIYLLKQYKIFLDTGVITQEGFDRVKKSLLAL